MTGWEPRKGVPGSWHLTFGDEVVSLCKTRVAGIERYVRRDPHKIDKHGGERCEVCWHEWSMMTAASLAKQDQHFAGECPVCGGRGWHTAGGNDPSACGRCPAGEIWAEGDA